MNRVILLLLGLTYISAAYSEEKMCGEDVTNKIISLREEEVTEQRALQALENVRHWIVAGSEYREGLSNQYGYSVSKMILDAYSFKLQIQDALNKGIIIDEDGAKIYCAFLHRKPKTT